MIPCELFSQFNLNCPEPLVALPLNITFPEPCGSNSILLFETLEENLFYVIKLNAVKDTLYVTESDPSLFNEKLKKGLKIINQKEPYYLLEKESEDWLNFFKNKGFNDSTLFYKR